LSILDTVFKRIHLVTTFYATCSARLLRTLPKTADNYSDGGCVLNADNMFPFPRQIY
jgi:hypothetical protein